jgi:fermentation-respiration switch protein FrsA (DUF1100 family)
MKRWQAILIAIVLGLVLILVVGLLWFSRVQAITLITQPMDGRSLPVDTPAKYGMPFSDVTVTSSDGLKLVGWYIPSKNGALVILQHGYKSNRSEMLNEADMLFRHGYGLLISSVRAHDYSEGERITFGMDEMKDMEAWYNFILTRSDVDPEKIGILGNSFGGMLAIHYAAQNKKIKAVVTDSSFSSLADTVETSIRFFTGLPPFPFAPLILFWGEREAGFKASEIDATVWIRAISPRPVFLMQGGADTIISTSSGQKLLDAAGEPKELWYDPEVLHAQFDTLRAQEFERRVVAFFDKYL